MKESSLINEWIEEGFRQGLEKAIEKGRQEGQLDGARKLLLRVLEIRIAAVLAELREAVNATTDLNRLSRWFDLALTTPLLEAFRTETGL